MRGNQRCSAPICWRAPIAAGRTKLLIWSALCFALLAISNLVLAADVLLLPTIDLTVVRLDDVTGRGCVLLYGFIWEA